MAKLGENRPLGSWRNVI